MDEQDVQIAVLQNEVAGLREQHRAHKQEITNALKEVADTFFDGMKEIRGDIKDIYEFVNQSKGKIVVLGFCMAGGGGLTVAIATEIIRHIWK